MGHGNNPPSYCVPMTIMYAHLLACDAQLRVEVPQYPLVDKVGGTGLRKQTTIFFFLACVTHAYTHTPSHDCTIAIYFVKINSVHKRFCVITTSQTFLYV